MKSESGRILQTTLVCFSGGRFRGDHRTEKKKNYFNYSTPLVLQPLLGLEIKALESLLGSLFQRIECLVELLSENVSLHPLDANSERKKQPKSVSPLEWHS